MTLFLVAVVAVQHGIVYWYEKANEGVEHSIFKVTSGIYACIDPW